MTLWRLVGAMEEGENDLFLSPFKDPLSREGLHKFFLGFQLKNAKETRFLAVCCQRYPRISAPSTPHRKEFSAPLQSTAPLYPSTSVAELALQQMALSLQTMCAFRNSALSSTKHSQGHNRLLRRRFATPSSPIGQGLSE